MRLSFNRWLTGRKEKTKRRSFQLLTAELQLKPQKRASDKKKKTDQFLWTSDLILSSSESAAPPPERSTKTRPPPAAWPVDAQIDPNRRFWRPPAFICIKPDSRSSDGGLKGVWTWFLLSSVTDPPSNIKWESGLFFRKHVWRSFEAELIRDVETREEPEICRRRGFFLKRRLTSRKWNFEINLKKCWCHGFWADLLFIKFYHDPDQTLDSAESLFSSSLNFLVNWLVNNYKLQLNFFLRTN